MITGYKWDYQFYKWGCKYLKLVKDHNCRETCHGKYVKHGEKNIGIWQNIEFLLVFVWVNEKYDGNPCSFVWISCLAFFFHDVTFSTYAMAWLLLGWRGSVTEKYRGNSHGIVITHSNRKSLVYSYWIGFLGKILTGNHRFSYQIWGFPVKIFP